MRPRTTPTAASAKSRAGSRNGYARCVGCGLREGHIETCEYARKRGVLTLRASIEVNGQHDVAKYLDDLRAQFANAFSIAVHEYYPDAAVRAWVEVADA